jgi:sugar phosphate permease
MNDLEQIQEDLKIIKERNKKVEADKAWETSYVRRFFLIIFTYLAIYLYMEAINVPKAWLNAIVPAVGFLLSTLTLPLLKRKWIKYFYKK